MKSLIFFLLIYSLTGAHADGVAISITQNDLYKEVAMGGSDEDRIKLADAYYSGTQESHQSYQQAFFWYSRAAGKIPRARYMLGVMAEAGQGTFKNMGVAVSHYAAAARMGSSAAQNRLGLIFLNGDQVEQDNVLSYFWLSVAALEYKSAIEPRNAALSRLTLDDLLEALKLREDFFKKVE